MLKMSRDHGETFEDTHLPSLRNEQFVNILDTSDQLVFAHVTDPKGEKLDVIASYVQPMYMYL